MKRKKSKAAPKFRRSRNPRGLGIADTSRTLRLGGSLALILPRKWVQANRIRRGQNLFLVGDRNLLIAGPRTQKRLSKKVESIVEEEKHRIAHAPPKRPRRPKKPAKLG